MTECQLTDEITGVDNTGLEMADEVARGEIDELENDGLKIDGPENDGRNKTDEKWTDIDGNGVM